MRYSLAKKKACLHGGGGPQVGEVIYLGGEPTWGPPPLCEEALIASRYRKEINCNVGFQWHAIKNEDGALIWSYFPHNNDMQ